MKRTISLIILVCTTYLILPSDAQADLGGSIRMSYSYGPNQFLPGFAANSGLEYSKTRLYSDIWTELAFQLSEKISFAGALELTDQPHALINTKFSRLDYPLSTGRFQRSVVRYSTDQFTASLGRDDMLSNPLRPHVFHYPTFGDGFSWKYDWNSWGFEHVFQVLPAEKAGDQIFRRSVSYHHLSRTINNFRVGAGEYFILTGDQIGLDLKRLNPFLPYSLNSHDSEADYFTGFEGDSDNSLIKLFLSWSKNTNKASLNLYIDEFQIDATDREVLNDALLFSFSAINELVIFGAENALNWGFSVGNPNFGQHPGPFTTPAIGAFPIFEYMPGMKNLVFFESNTRVGSDWDFSLAVYSEHWVNISKLSPELMNKRVELDRLELNSDSRFMLGLNYEAPNYPVSLGLAGWLNSTEKPSSGISLQIQFNAGNFPKQ